jgi:hypothetical protein
MKNLYRIAGMALLVSVLSSTAYAQPPHDGGLPPGLQKKLERGEPLPPAWRDRTEDYGFSQDEAAYGQYDYEESYSYQYEPEYVEDTVYRLIKDTRLLMSILAQ